MRNTENERIKTGVPIAIKTKLIHIIVKINRINSKIMAIRLEIGENVKNISIINSYATCMNYRNAEKNGYWALINDLHRTIQGKYNTLAY